MMILGRYLNHPKVLVQNLNLQQPKSLGSKEVPASGEKLPDKIDSAYQGQEALECVRKALCDKQPYALAFVDVRMPPGWDGIETIKRIWEVDADIQIVICTAYSDYTWEEISNNLKHTDSFLILKKPFDPMEIRQLSASLSKKWLLQKQVRYQMENLQALVNERTADLEKTFSLSKATLESTQEGILSISKDKKISSFNHKYLDLWKMSREVIESMTLEKLFHKMASYLEDSDLFYSEMNSLSQSPKVGVGREWSSKDGKVLELYTHPQYLYGEVVGCVFSFRDITEQKRLEKQLLHEATHDVLTGLPNRILLADRIQQAIINAKRHKLFVGVLLLDLDNFKRINDSLGHEAGDTLLKTVALRLRSRMRESDTVSRLGGDEFVVLLGQTREEFLIEIIKELHTLFNTPCEIKGHKLIVTSSIGVSIFPRDGDDAETLIKNADAAMYHAKELGRNTFQFYKKEFNEQMLEREELITELRIALNNHEFLLHYQPLIQLSTGNIVGLEALIRWLHPTKGLLYPDFFIPLAEETGSIIEIGDWVLKTACLQNKIWQKQIDPNLSMAVNVSALQFRQKNFVEKIKQILEETNYDPNLLNLEITESLILGNPSDVAQKMMELKKLGIHFSMDDFGTGYASLSYLKVFPFDKIKIDKSFIKNIIEIVKIARLLKPLSA